MCWFLVLIEPHNNGSFLKQVYSPIIQNIDIVVMWNIMKLHSGYHPSFQEKYPWLERKKRLKVEPLHPIPPRMKNRARCCFNLPGKGGFVGHDTEAFLAIVWVLPTNQEPSPMVWHGFNCLNHQNWVQNGAHPHVPKEQEYECVPSQVRLLKQNMSNKLVNQLTLDFAKHQA